jgi:hypothetical protein
VGQVLGQVHGQGHTSSVGSRDDIPSQRRRRTWSEGPGGGIAFGPRNERSDVDDERSVAPEALGQHLVSL